LLENIGQVRSKIYGLVRDFFDEAETK